jgi:hypothetical protein
MFSRARPNAEIVRLLAAQRVSHPMIAADPDIRVA